MNNEDNLMHLIHSWKSMDERGCLTRNGKEYLSGLEKAHDIIFPCEVKDDVKGGKDE